jgi:hypothetical protein
MNEASTTLEIIGSFLKGMLPILTGAISAILGGWLGYEIRAKRQDDKELRSIKITIGDELVSIRRTIDTMHQAWTRSSQLYAPDIADLGSNTVCFEELRTRLFLIGDDSLRSDIRDFYREFKELLKKSEGKVGSLSDTEEAKAEQAKIHDDFVALGTKAVALNTRLNSSTTS